MTTGTSAQLICSDCRRGIEWCAFCDGQECAAGVCYGCLVVALRQPTPMPHTHGG